MKKRLTLQFLVPIAVALVFILLGSFGLFDRFDNRIYDAFLRIKPAIPQSKKLLLIDVDDTSIAKVGVWPWSRNIMSDGLVTMREFGAAYAVFDIEYVNESPLGVNGTYLHQTVPRLFAEHFGEINQNTAALVQALQQGTIPMASAGDYLQQLTSLTDSSRKLLLAKVDDIARNNDELLGEGARVFHHAYFTVNFTPAAEPLSPDYEQWVLDHVALTGVTAHGEYGHVVSGLSPTIKPVLTAAAGAGFPRVVVDGDGVRRRVDLVYQYKGKYFGQLVFRPLLSYLGDPAVELYANRIELRGARVPGGARHDISIPLTPQGHFLINWPKSDYRHSFDHLSYYQMVLAQRQEAALLTLLRGMADANYLSFYPGGTDLFAPYDRAAQLEADLRTGGDPSQIEEYRSLRAQFFTSVGGFLSSGAEQGILAQIDGALASPQITADQRAQFQAVRKDVEGKFAQTRTIYSALIESRSILAQALAGKFCIIGNSATSSTDLGVNPFAEQYANVGTHASIANTILNERFIRLLPGWYGLVLAALLPLIVFVSLRRLEPLPSVILGAGEILFFLAVALATFLAFRIYLSLTAPVLSMTTTYLVLIILKFLTTAREKSYIRNAFGRYLSGDVINELLANPDKLSLGGDKQELTAFFTDVRGFSTISEQLDPSDLVRLLNAYLTEMSDIILNERGTIDKYEGDAIMSFFGAPIPFADHARNACRAAVGIKRAERALNERFVADRLSPSPLLTRIGINTGEMVVGNMGTANKMDYTVMGNSVNLASRLEGVNKQYGTWILTSESTRSACADEFVFRRLDRVRVVGIHEPVRLYELIDDGFDGAGISRENVEIFHQALDHFEAKRWSEARATFSRLLEENPEDGPTLAFLKRCDQYLKSEPPPEWDGVFNLSVK